MNKTTRRRLAVESLETRLLLDASAMASLPAGPVWEQVIVSLHENVANPRAVGQGVVDKHGGQLGHTYEHALKGFSAQLPAAAVAALQRNPNVKLVEPDLEMQAFAQLVPTGVSRIAAAPGIAPPIDASGVNIAILDTGIDGSHPDLNVAGGVSFVGGSWNDGHGHGTHVAGTAAAIDNNIGVVGVAPGAKLWAVKVLRNNGSGSLSGIIAGIDWVTGTRTDSDPANDIHVANMSLGGTGVSSAYRAAIQNSVAEGVVYVVAAGNSGRDIHGSDKKFETSDDTIPAAYPEVATIAAFGDKDGLPGGTGGNTSWGPDDTFADFSNFSNSDGDINNAFLSANQAILGADRHALGLGIDLMLPGVEIYSTYPGGYATMSGTSMAAPHATGLAARYIAANSPATDANGVYEVRRALIDAGKRWRDPDDGLKVVLVNGGNPDSPDNYEENLGWAGNTVAVALPTVAITDPSSGGAVSGDTVAVTVVVENVDPNNPVTEVRLFLGDTHLLGTSYLAPDGSGEYLFAWDTTATDANSISLYPDGSYTLTAVAVTSNDEVSHSITVSVDNVDDPPSVSIISPADDTTVSGMVTLTAEATDDRGVVGVEFFVGETSIGPGVQSVGTGVWSVSWDTDPTYIDGEYIIVAKATDSGGNTSDSASRNVTVKNSVATMTGTLTGSSTQVNKNFWQANVTLTLQDGNNALPGAVVTGRWNSNSSTVSGTTDSNGKVSFSSGNLSTKSVASIDFTDIAVELAGYEYEGSDAIRINKNGSSQPLATNLKVPLAIEQSSEPATPKKPNPVRLGEASVDYLMALDNWQVFSVGQSAGRDELASVRPRPARSDIFDNDLTAFLHRFEVLD